MVVVRWKNGEQHVFAGHARALKEGSFTIEPPRPGDPGIDLDADGLPREVVDGAVLPIAVIHSGDVLWVANLPGPAVAP